MIIKHRLRVDKPHGTVVAWGPIAPTSVASPRLRVAFFAGRPVATIVDRFWLAKFTRFRWFMPSRRWPADGAVREPVRRRW